MRFNSSKATLSEFPSKRLLSAVITYRFHLSDKFHFEMECEDGAKYILTFLKPFSEYRLIGEHFSDVTHQPLTEAGLLNSDNTFLIQTETERQFGFRYREVENGHCLPHSRFPDIRKMCEQSEIGYEEFMEPAFNLFTLPASERRSKNDSN